MAKRLKMDLNKGKKGWILLPIEGDTELINELYGSKYEEMTEDARYFRLDLDLGAVSEFLLEIASGCRFQANFIEPTMFEVAEQLKPISFNIDFKWSLWMSDMSVWDAETREASKLAFAGEGAPVIIHTAPRKEIRYGTVVISQGKANVEFYAVWDSPIDLIPENCPKKWKKKMKEEIETYFTFGYGFYDGGENPIGASVQNEVTASTFEELLQKIDTHEEELLELERESSKEFHAYCESILKNGGEER